MARSRAGMLTRQLRPTRNAMPVNRPDDASLYTVSSLIPSRAARYRKLATSAGMGLADVLVRFSIASSSVNLPLRLSRSREERMRAKSRATPLRFHRAVRLGFLFTRWSEDQTVMV